MDRGVVEGGHDDDASGLAWPALEDWISHICARFLSVFI